jgi:hypothetical protein
MQSVKIPQRLARVFTDPQLFRAFSEAKDLVNKTPSPWVVVEVPSEGGVQPMDVPFRSEPVDLSPEEEEAGRKQMARAYKRIDTALKQMDQQIIQLENSPLRRLLTVIGSILILVAVVTLILGIFRDSHIQLVGKGGGASLLLTTGVSLLTALLAKDRKLRTLSSRIRARLAVCRSYSDYDAARRCFQDAIEDINLTFGQIRNRIQKSGTG